MRHGPEFTLASGPTTVSPAALGREAGVAAQARPGGKVLSIVSGIYGAHLAGELCERGADVIEVHCDYNDALDVQSVAEALSADPDIDVLSVVHCESALGTLDRLEQIGAVARRHDVLVLVDAVASLGSESVDPDGWGLDLCIAGPQKCLAGPLALALMTGSPRAWSAIVDDPSAPRASFLSLIYRRDMWIWQGRFPSAPPVSDVVALAAACGEVLAEGLDLRYARHEPAAAACRAGIVGIGFEFWALAGGVPPAITTALLADAVSDTQVAGHIRERYSIKLSSGTGLANLVRIDAMGETAPSVYPAVGVPASAQGLRDLAVDVDIGSGVTAAMTVLAAA
ncbi:MAG: aminotransferase class V-fold PLP-dependent enzyme [Phycisphaeraceae bacterium]